MQNNSPIAAGQTESDELRTQRIDAINQAFALFKLNYHNQYYKAFSQEQEFNSVRRLWLDALQHYSPTTIINAARSVITSSEFLPTLKTMLDHCNQCSSSQIPDAHAAYVEACCAPSPKVDYEWSHPLVYHAGAQCGWQFLQGSNEDSAFPVFKKIYQELCEQLRTGKEFSVPQQPALEQKPGVPASDATRKKYVEGLKNLLRD